MNMQTNGYDEEWDDLDPFDRMNNRPSREIYLPGNVDFKKRSDILNICEKMINDGGVLVLPFDEDMEFIPWFLLSVISGGMQLDGRAVLKSQFLGAPYLPSPPDQAQVWIIHHAPCFANFIASVQEWLKPGRLVIATGLTWQWDALEINLPSRRMDILLQTDIIDTDAASVMDDTCVKLPEEQQDLIKVVRIVSMFAAWGAYPPDTVLARMAGFIRQDGQEDTDRLEEVVEAGVEKKLLVWVTIDKPPSIQVARPSDAKARNHLRGLAQEKGIGIKDYANLLVKVDQNVRDERYAFLNLMQGWLADSHLRASLAPEKRAFGIRAIREIITSNPLQGKIKSIKAAVESAAESLVWGRCMMRLGILDLGLGFLDRGLSANRRNPFLLHARAHLLGRWAATRDDKVDEARNAYNDATDVCRENYYVWQNFGVFEAEQRNYKIAADLFDRALLIEPRNVFSLVARANMYLDMGDIVKAEEDIRAASGIAPENSYVVHLRGRAAFFRGEWAAAKAIWQDELLKLDPRNLHARQSLGFMARERGFWDDAEKALKEAQEMSPENIPVLHELGLLHMDRALWEPKKSRDEDLEMAREGLLIATDVEPENPQVIVSLATVERLKGDQELMRGAAARLEELKRRSGGRPYILHALAMCLHLLNRTEDRDGLFDRILEKSPGNIRTLIAMSECAYDENRHPEAETTATRARRSYDQKKALMPANEKIGALLDLARLYRKLGRVEAADGFLEEAGKIDRQNAKIALLKRG
ncbi:MAG: hypothetical protein JW884_01275 [Deltaproteobacteria bacterium]|nr:hypothetical protein [Deltaproteobacteria bacterium]